MTVNNELDNIGEWFKANKLSLNNNKKQIYKCVQRSVAILLTDPDNMHKNI